MTKRTLMNASNTLLSAIDDVAGWAQNNGCDGVASQLVAIAKEIHAQANVVMEIYDSLDPRRADTQKIMPEPQAETVAEAGPSRAP